MNHTARVIWLTGLSGAGKTTLASALEKKLKKEGIITVVFDGDIMRKGINKDLGFSETDRMENIRRTAEIAKLFIDQGIVVICSFISPLKSMRELAKNIIGNNNFTEVFLNCHLEVCEKRDIKGLYKKARKGIIKNFTGVTAPYEAPEHPDIELLTGQWSINRTNDLLAEKILNLLRK